jgi:hypothetical protein
MYRLFPGLSFEVQDVVVRGGPWHTRIFTQLEFVKPLPDGTRYGNVVMQRMVMRWGRITEIQTLEDTQRCLRLLGIGLPLAIGLGTLAAFILPGVSDIWLALLIGAALAPTDAA